MNYKGSQKAKLHISIGLFAHSVATVYLPHLAAELVIVSLAVNIIWVWEG